LKLWFGLNNKGKEKEKRTKETMEEIPSRARFASVKKNEREVLEFHAKGGDKNAFFLWKWTIGKRIVVLHTIFMLK
jgi:hypothetical protein